MSSYHMVCLKFVDGIVCVESSITYKQVPSEISCNQGVTWKLPECNAVMTSYDSIAFRCTYHHAPSWIILPLDMDLYIFWMELNHSLRMPAPVFFSIVGDVPLLRILRESGLDDMNVRDGWDIHIAVAYCWEISLYLYRNYFFTPAYKGNRLFHDKTWTYHHVCVCVCERGG